MKKCIKCNIEKFIDKFIFRKDSNKYRNICIECQKQHNKQYNKKYSLEHKEQKKACDKKWKLNNQKYKKEYDKQYIKNKRKTDINFNTLDNLRTRIYNALKSSGVRKSKRTIELIGCTIPELKLHLENQFKDGMSWENRGSFHIDHIIPCDEFDLTNIEEQKKCFHYTNLQPLSPEDNLKKSNKILPEYKDKYKEVFNNESNLL